MVKGFGSYTRLLPVALLVGGCYTGLDVDADGVASGGAESGGEDSGGSCEAADEPATTHLRRLTPTQHANTVRDLFPGVDLPPQALVQDPRVHGFENFGEMQNPSALLVEQVRQAAVTVSSGVLGASDEVIGCPADGGSDPVGCGERYLGELLPRAFRRPVDAAELEAHLAFFRTQVESDGFEIAMQLSLQAALQSPDFLYLLEPAGESTEDGLAALEPYAMASRLSYFLWDTMPDEALFAAAGAGALATRDEVESQARRMLDDPRAREGSIDFHRQWLDFDQLQFISPDPGTYPDFVEANRDEMRNELESFVTQVIFDGEGTLASLLTSNQTWVNDRLAAYYGVENPNPGAWGLATLDPARRAGLLTLTGWLSARAHAVHPSPVQRGVFVLERMLCRPPPAPPADVNTDPPIVEPGTTDTNRERYRQHTVDPICQACHQSIDGIGFGFEHYDSIGRWRDQDNGNPVDASGALVGTDVDGDFNGAVELANQLAGSEDVARCMVTQYYRHALGRTETAADTCALDAMNEAFVESEGSIRELMVAVATSQAFRTRSEVE